jgi:hypothetical protein
MKTNDVTTANQSIRSDLQLAILNWHFHFEVYPRVYKSGRNPYGRCLQGFRRASGKLGGPSGAGDKLRLPLTFTLLNHMAITPPSYLYHSPRSSFRAWIESY